MKLKILKRMGKNQERKKERKKERKEHPTCDRTKEG